jgi:hypothetical protein
MILFSWASRPSQNALPPATACPHILLRKVMGRSILLETISIKYTDRKGAVRFRGRALDGSWDILAHPQGT